MKEMISMIFRRREEFAIAAILGLIVSGCFTPAESQKSTPSAEKLKSSAQSSAPAQSSVPEGQATKIGTEVASIAPAGAAKSAPASAKSEPAASPSSSGLEPFQAPPLSEIDAKAEWQPQPILDGLDLMRERQAQEKPLATAEEALSLRNTNAEANSKITSALGRLPTKDSDVDWDASFIRVIAADVKSTNPVLISSIYEFELSNLTGFALFNFDWKLQPFATKGTVKSWQTSKDRMYDKVVMRNDLTWSDGRPITAHDVVFSFKLILDPRVPIPAVRAGADQIRWIEAYNDQTLVFFHKQAAATNVWNLNFPVLPRHIYEHNDDDPTLQNSPRFVKYENEPVVGGP